MEFILFILKVANSLKVPAFLRILGKTILRVGQNKLCEIILSKNRRALRLFFFTSV